MGRPFIVGYLPFVPAGFAKWRYVRRQNDMFVVCQRTRKHAGKMRRSLVSQSF